MKKKNKALAAISFYQKHISPLFPPMCRYYPTCSQYTYEAIEKYGFFIGGFLGFKRLMRCNIFWPGGVDPVPELKEKYRRKKTDSTNSPEDTQ